MPLRNLLLLVASAIFSLMCYNETERNRYAAILSEALQVVEERYIEPIDRRRLFEGAMQGMVGQLDEYSNFIPPADFTQLQESLDQKFGGIGIIVELDPETKRITVLSPLVGTPAYRAGMRAGDTILKINGQTAEELGLREAVDVMRGQPGSLLRLSVLHAGDEEPVDFEIERAIIPIQSVLGDTHTPAGDWSFTLEENPRIGFIRITSFGENTVKELREALKFNGQQVDGLIIDMRDNAGGFLTAAVEVCDMFIDDGEIVTTRGRDRTIRQQFNATRKATIVRDLPIAVIVNRYSASAAEIVAACLQDHGRAIIIGQRSWGKGTVQNIIQLEGGRSALKLTTASYWRPSGANIHRARGVGEEGEWGVRPDDGHEVILTDDEARKVVQQRRRRDVIHLGESPSASPPRPNDNGGADASEPFDDPQLRRAIEAIERRLSTELARPQAA